MNECMKTALPSAMFLQRPWWGLVRVTGFASSSASFRTTSEVSGTKLPDVFLHPSVAFESALDGLGKTRVVHLPWFLLEGLFSFQALIQPPSGNSEPPSKNCMGFYSRAALIVCFGWKEACCRDNRRTSFTKKFRNSWIVASPTSFLVNSSSEYDFKGTPQFGEQFFRFSLRARPNPRSASREVAFLSSPSTTGLFYSFNGRTYVGVSGTRSWTEFGWIKAAWRAKGCFRKLHTWKGAHSTVVKFLAQLKNRLTRRRRWTQNTRGVSFGRRVAGAPEDP